MGDPWGKPGHGHRCAFSFFLFAGDLGHPTSGGLLINSTTRWAFRTHLMGELFTQSGRWAIVALSRGEKWAHAIEGAPRGKRFGTER